MRNSDTGKEKISHILDAGSRAAELIRQILSFSRSQKISPKPVNHHIIAKEVLNLLKDSLPATIEIKRILNSKSTVFADPTSIHQFLMNLCTNAGHSMRKTGGTLTVSLEDVTLDENEVANYPSMAAGKFIKICVMDIGPGIPPDIQDKISILFFTTKGPGEGTGMGLSAVHGIIKKLGGMVALNSEAGRGSVFTVLLPIIERPIKDTEREGIGVAYGETQRIMFVDDEANQGELVKESLMPIGYQVIAFTDSITALKHFRFHSDEYDIVVTDMTMPKMTGDVLTKRIHLIRSDIPAIVCTGFSEIIDEEKAKAIGLSALMHKPIVVRDSTRFIRGILD